MKKKNNFLSYLKQCDAIMDDVTLSNQETCQQIEKVFRNWLIKEHNKAAAGA